MRVLHSGVGRGRGFPARLLGFITLLIRRLEHRRKLQERPALLPRRLSTKSMEAEVPVSPAYEPPGVNRCVIVPQSGADMSISRTLLVKGCTT